MKHSSIIFTCSAIIGVASTAILAVKETPKALKLLSESEKTKGEPLSNKEKVCIAAPAYIPAIITGSATVACIVLSNRQQNAIAKAFLNYRNTLINLHGEKADREVMTEMVRTRCDCHPTDVDTPDQKVVFYDDISGNSIEAYERDVIDAEYHLNRNFTLRGFASLNEFYQFLGMPEMPYGNELGWTSTDGFGWIDFEHHQISRDDGGPDIYSIDMIFEPSPDYLNEW